jgi:hypothetical protein
VAPDYSLESSPLSGIGKHRVILIDQFINAAVDVQTGKKHLGTTDAYQALGKPFSFTPPISAAIAESSKLGFLNLVALLYFATGTLTVLLGSIGFSNYQQSANLVRSVLVIMGIASLVGGYLILRKTRLGPVLALAATGVGLVGYTILRVPSSGLIDYGLDTLLLVYFFFFFTARTVINTLREKQWHPLDMPAYG